MPPDTQRLPADAFAGDEGLVASPATTGFTQVHTELPTYPEPTRIETTDAHAQPYRDSVPLSNIGLAPSVSLERKKQGDESLPSVASPALTREATKEEQAVVQSRLDKQRAQQEETMAAQNAHGQRSPGTGSDGQWHKHMLEPSCDCENVLLSFFATPYQFARTHGPLNKGGFWTFWPLFILAGFAWMGTLLGYPFAYRRDLVGMLIGAIVCHFTTIMLGCCCRERFKDKYEIDEDECDQACDAGEGGCGMGSCCAYLCCPWCSVAQEAAHKEAVKLPTRTVPSASV